MHGGPVRIYICIYLRTIFASKLSTIMSNVNLDSRGLMIIEPKILFFLLSIQLFKNEINSNSGHDSTEHGDEHGHDHGKSDEHEHGHEHGKSCGHDHGKSDGHEHGHDHGKSEEKHDHGKSDGHGHDHGKSEEKHEHGEYVHPLHYIEIFVVGYCMSL